MGGTTLAKDVVFRALRAGKDVVTANKALIADCLPEIETVVAEANAAQGAGAPRVQFGYEAAVCGGIPIIHTMNTDFVGDEVTRLRGIMNGCTNFMLTKMEAEGLSYADCLAEATALGYAEEDPTLDVGGFDARSKLAILVRLAFGVDVDETLISCTGIAGLETIDFEYARGQLDGTIKLLGVAELDGAGGLTAYVTPALVPRGAGTGGSRSLQLGGTAVSEAAHELYERARKLAAHLLEAAAEDVEITDEGIFGVAGVPGGPTATWSDVHRQAAATGEELHVGLDSAQDVATFPFGAHLSVVEVDTDTGRVTPRRHVAVDDCGRILNPLLVEGQQHGGLAQGVAQALHEEVLFDDEGQPLTSSLAAYTIPTAADLFSFETATTETPTPLNSLGAKGIGESATIGSTPAVQNAVVDALSDLGVRHIDLPCTPERVWRAVAAARAGAPEQAWREPPAVFDDLPVRGGGAEDDAAI